MQSSLPLFQNRLEKVHSQTIRRTEKKETLKENRYNVVPKKTKRIEKNRFNSAKEFVLKENT